MDLSGKNIVVIGSGGLGLSTIRLLLQKKIANLIIIDCMPSLPELNDLRNQYPGTTILYFPLDITKKEDVERIFDQVFQNFKRVDVLLNAAGVLDDRHKPELTINWGLVNTTLVAYSHMDKSKGGQGGLIANVASILGLMTCPPLAVYSATKAGVISFTRSLSGNFYHSKSGVSLTVICPGLTITPMTENLEEKTTFPYRPDAFGESEFPPQSAEDCAKNIVRAIEKNKNGSIWICKDAKLNEAKLDDGISPGAWD